MIAENPETAPTDRSNPPAMNTSVPPAAMIPTGVAWNARFFMFAEVRNALLDSESVMNSAMNASTTPYSRMTDTPSQDGTPTPR